MKAKRIFILLLCIIEFFLFSALMLLGFVMLFHAAVLSFPLWSFLWTLFFFDLIWLLTLKYNLKLRIIWSLIAAFYSYFVISTLFLYSLSEGSIPKTNLTVIIINCALAFLISIYVIIKAIKLVKFLKASIREKVSRIKAEALSDETSIVNKPDTNQ